MTTFTTVNRPGLARLHQAAHRRHPGLVGLRLVNTMGGWTTIEAPAWPGTAVELFTLAQGRVASPESYAAKE